MKRSASYFALIVFAFTTIHAFAAGEQKKSGGASARDARKTFASEDAKKSAAPVGEAKNPAAVQGSGRHYTTLRGEIVDFYCYIEKGLTGPAHKDCGTRCVAGDICMGLLTTEGDLFMISRNHLRSMDPLSFRGQVDPFNLCTAMISEKVDLTGYAMERKGQRIIEIVKVAKAVGPPPKAGGTPPLESQ